MLALLALALFIAVFACVFALQNAHAVAISFLTFKYEASLALILLSTFAMGALVAILASLPAMIKKKLTIADLKGKIKALEKPAPRPEGENDASKNDGKDSGRKT